MEAILAKQLREDGVYRILDKIRPIEQNTRGSYDDYDECLRLL